MWEWNGLISVDAAFSSSLYSEELKADFPNSISQAPRALEPKRTALGGDH